MLKKVWVAALTWGLAAVMLSSCGRDDKPPTQPIVGNGALYILVTDVPACDVVSFHARFSTIALKIAGKEDTVRVLSGERQFPVRVNFASLRDFSNILILASVPAVTYDEAQFIFSLPQLGLFDPARTPSSFSVFPTFSTTTPAVPILPNLVVTENKVSVLRIDFDMLRSLQLDDQGQINGHVTPILTVTPVPVTEGVGFGDLHNLSGFIRTVSPFSPGQGFTGSFSLQLLAGTGPAITVNLTADTQLYGAPALNQVETGRYVEVEAFLDEKGNVVARLIEVQERAVVEQNKIAFLGYVTSVTRDEEGNLTQFNLHVREEEPDVSFSVPLDSAVVVNVTPETQYQFSSRAANFASLTFDQSAINLGQELIVHGQFTRTEDQPTTVDATKIYLKLQTVQGRFSSLVSVGSDGRTGAFWLTPCCSIYQGGSVLVITNNETTFLNVFGLGDLRPQPALLVMGLPFHQPADGTINGIAVPAGTMALLAKQVHQLQ